MIGDECVNFFDCVCCGWDVMCDVIMVGMINYCVVDVEYVV